MPHRRRDEDGADDQHGQQRPLFLVAGAAEHVLDVGGKGAGLGAGAFLEAWLAVGVVADDGKLVSMERLAAAGADALVEELFALLVGGAALGTPVAALVILEALAAR